MHCCSIFFFLHICIILYQSDMQTRTNLPLLNFLEIWAGLFLRCLRIVLMGVGAFTKDYRNIILERDFGFTLALRRLRNLFWNPRILSDVHCTAV